ncbi:HAMP domain-containing sensor histidine kinase [Flavobacterium sp.]|uniref:sensor histidine kinase n=1 Tax=Flavobacterium sp. TaxID=239 RepID=UPI0025C19882|nr:HAMP domain-containing sensor histidine kinase [Flavobacterium sp.]
MIRKILYYLDLNLNTLRKRKFVQIILLLTSIFALLILVILLYNEFVNENKLQKYKENLDNSSALIKQKEIIKDDYATIHKNLQDFLNSKDTIHLLDYYQSLENLNNHVNSFIGTVSKDESLAAYLNQEKINLIRINEEKQLLDSLISVQKNPKNKIDFPAVNFNSFDYKDILNSVQVESYMLVDSVERKGLFSRIGDAFSGKVDVQKEKLNVTITMKYGKNVTTGNIEEQLANAFKRTNSFYYNEFGQLRKKLNTTENFAENNYTILMHSEFIINSINKALTVFDKTNKQNFDNQFRTNNSIRRYTIFGLLFVLFIISGILIILTYLAFNYENRLIESKEKLRQSLNFKNRIVGMISHEIRSPLNILSMYLKSIFNNTNNPSLKESVQSIQYTTNSMSLMVNQILEFSKNENKKLILNKERFNLKQNIEETLKNLNCLVESNQNQLIIQSNITNDCFVDSDKIKLQQLLYNLVGNANKFTSNGQIKVGLYIVNEFSKNINLLLTVEDSGIGISNEDLKYVFEDYYQGTISDKVNNLGIGLGLNLCKEIVELFEGDINITSKVNQGTKVECSLFFEVN